MTLYVHGFGHFHPDNEITNAFLEELEIGTNDEWILDRVGIRSRRTVLPLDYIRETRNADVREAPGVATLSAAECGAKAAELALARAGIDRSDVGLLIGGSSAPDFVTPAEAANIAYELEMEVPVFDINSACTSFIAQLHLLDNMKPEALPDYVLIVTPEIATKIIDYTDRASAVLWGDGAAAAVVSTKVAARARVEGTRLDSSPAGHDKVVVPRTGYFAQDGRAVQLFAVRETARLFEVLRGEYDEPTRRLHFVGHQANLRMLEAVCRRSDIAADRHHFNVDWYGNTAAASSASVISMRWEKWEEVDDVAVVGVGAGLTWAAYVLRFGAPA